MFPFVPLAMAGASIAAGLYSGHQSRIASKYQMDYQKQLRAENDRFWTNYKKNHHWSSNRQIKYPYRSGYYFNNTSYYSALANYNSSYARNIAGSFGAIGGAYLGSKKYYSNKQSNYRRRY